MFCGCVPYCELHHIGVFPRGKKRNSSVQELCDSPSKKPKLDCAKAPKPKGVNSVADDKSSLHQQQDKTSALSKQASKGGKHNNEVTSQSCSSGLQEVHKVAEAAKDKGKQKKASPLKQNHVATPKSIQKSPRKDKIVGKKLKLDSDGEKNMKDELKAGNDSSSEESSDDEGVAWEDVDGKSSTVYAESLSVAQFFKTPDPLNQKALSSTNSQTTRFFKSFLFLLEVQHCES